MTVLGRLTTLTHLDDVLVAEEEAAYAVQMAAASKINQVKMLQILMFIYIIFNVYLFIFISIVCKV